ncbi:M20/M25/M40 family metallo-hydrolase [Mesorhizobium atlanticum]
MSERLFKAVEDRVDDLSRTDREPDPLPDRQSARRGLSAMRRVPWRAPEETRLRNRIHPCRGRARPTATAIRASTWSPASTAARPALACISTHISTWSKRATAGPVDPFAGVVKDGRVYGRGACDMKGGLAGLRHRGRSLHGSLSGFSRRHRDIGHGG